MQTSAGLQTDAIRWLIKVIATAWHPHGTPLIKSMRPSLLVHTCMLHPHHKKSTRGVPDLMKGVIKNWIKNIQIHRGEIIPSLAQWPKFWIEMCCQWGVIVPHIKIHMYVGNRIQIFVCLKCFKRNGCMEIAKGLHFTSVFVLSWSHCDVSAVLGWYWEYWVLS